MSIAVTRAYDCSVVEKLTAREAIMFSLALASNSVRSPHPGKFVIGHRMIGVRERYPTVRHKMLNTD